MRATILAFVLAVVARATCADGRVGTFVDAVTVFGCAFALDLTVEAAQTAPPGFGAPVKR